MEFPFKNHLCLRQMYPIYFILIGNPESFKSSIQVSTKRLKKLKIFFVDLLFRKMIKSAFARCFNSQPVVSI